jgi:hypothetical protein
MARGDAAEVLEPSEAARDEFAFFGCLFVMPDAFLAIGFTAMTGLIPCFPRKPRNALVNQN